MRVWMRAVISVGLLAALVLILPWGVLRSAVGRLTLSLWLAILLGFLASHTLSLLKWRLLLRAAGARLRLSAAVRSHAAGLFANLFLPGLVGGDVLRAALAARSSGNSEGAVLGSLVDRAADIASLAVLILIGGILSRAAASDWTAEALATGVFAVALLGFAFVPFAARRRLNRWPRRMRRSVGRMLVALRRIGRRPSLLAAALALSLAIQMLLVILNSVIGRAIGIDVPLAVWFLVWPLAKAVALLPISLGGLGVRDATFAALMLSFGVPPAIGIVVSLAWQSVVIAAGAVAGAVWWLLPSEETARRAPWSDLPRFARSQGNASA